MTRDSGRRVLRTFVIAFLGVLLPGAFSWLNALTEWARNEGQTPFPDARSLAFVGVAAIVAGFIALLNLLVVWVEDVTGRGILRNVPARPRRDQVGAAIPTWGVVVIVVLAIVVAFLLL